MSKKELLVVCNSIFLGFVLMSLSTQVNTIPVRDAFTDLILTDGWWSVVLGIIFIVLGLSYFHAFKEAGRIIKGKWPHAKRAILRILVFASLALLISRDINLIWLALTGIAAATFAVCFDIFYNYHKGYRGWKVITYLGTQAAQDITFRKIPLVLLAIDVASLVLSIWFFTKVV